MCTVRGCLLCPCAGCMVHCVTYLYARMHAICLRISNSLFVSNRTTVPLLLWHYHTSIYACMIQYLACSIPYVVVWHATAGMQCCYHYYTTTLHTQYTQYYNACMYAYGNVYYQYCVVLLGPGHVRTCCYCSYLCVLLCECCVVARIHSTTTLCYAPLLYYSVCMHAYYCQYYQYCLVLLGMSTCQYCMAECVPV